MSLAPAPASGGNTPPSWRPVLAHPGGEARGLTDQNDLSQVHILEREREAISASLYSGFFRPADQVPTCGTSDPGVMQMMMLPAAAFGDIMMTNVMNPIMDMFSGRNKGTERHEESERSSQSKREESGSKRSWRVSPPQSRRPKSRRDWWRALGRVQKEVGG